MSMSNKEQAMQQNRTTGISFSLRFEGGFCNDPRDPGGATNKGITFATFKADVDPHGTLPNTSIGNNL